MVFAPLFVKLLCTLSISLRPFVVTESSDAPQRNVYLNLRKAQILMYQKRIMRTGAACKHADIYLRPDWRPLTPSISTHATTQLTLLFYPCTIFYLQKIQTCFRHEAVVTTDVIFLTLITAN